MKQAVINIVLVCLDSQFNKLVSQEIAEKLDMFFADLESFIEYDLIDSKAILEKCGIEYLADREMKATQSFAKFENSVLTVDFDLFKANRSAFSHQSLIVYLRLGEKMINKKESINIISFKARDQYLLNNSDLVVSLKSKAKGKAVKEIISSLQEAL